MPRIVVIGGGPAGMMAAGQAAELGAEVILFEKTLSTGRKLRLTGAGRCNLTNTLDLENFMAHIPGNGRFLRQALTHFSSTNLIAFVDEIGVPTLVEPNGRVYPASGRAVDIVNALNRWMLQSGVQLRADSPVNRLVIKNALVTGVESSGGVEPVDAVIIATGGASYPETGSTGDGYRLAEAVGHTIVPIRPSIVPLEISGDLPSRLQGLSLPRVDVRLMAGDKQLTAITGEILFTHFGVSGPAVLAVSRWAVDVLKAGKTVTLALDLLPHIAEETLQAQLLDSLKRHGKRHVANILNQWLPARFTPIVTQRCEIAAETRANQLGATQRKRLAKMLKDFDLSISSHRPLAEAVVTAGGVDTREVDPRTMRSRLVKNLYFAGEVLDVDGDSGGFNLQIAFSTGWLAGTVSAQRQPD